VAEFPVYQIDSFQHTISLAAYTRVLLDPDDAYDLKAVRQADVQQGFYPLSEYPDNRFSDIENPWGKVSIQNRLSDRHLLSFAFYSYADSILVDVVREDGSVENYKMGIHVPSEETHTGSPILQDVHYTYPTVFVNLRENERIDIFFKIHPTPYCNCELNPVVRSMEFNYQKQYSLPNATPKPFFIWAQSGCFACTISSSIFFTEKRLTFFWLCLRSVLFSPPTLCPFCFW